MERKINKNINKLNTEKITTVPFDDIIAHSDIKRTYFTVANNDIIYKRLKDELTIEHLPYLGPCVDFGMGDVCLEESFGTFKFYIIDRTLKFEYEEFTKIEDAIEKLVSYYTEYEMVNNHLQMKEIFYQTLGLKKNENINIKDSEISKTLKLRNK